MGHIRWEGGYPELGSAYIYFIGGTVTSRFVASIPGQMYTPSTGNEHMGMYTADSLSNLCALEIDVQIFIRRPYDLADLTEGLAPSLHGVKFLSFVSPDASNDKFLLFLVQK
jgi:hypothetical protein